MMIATQDGGEVDGAIEMRGLAVVSLPARRAAAIPAIL
jgi:hypothetical protein